MSGTVAILSVGAGDIKLSFDSDDVSETIRARRTVKDMLRRGYALLVEREDGKYQRVHEFDESTNEYIIADFDPEYDGEEHEETEEAAPKKGPPKKAGARKKRVVKKRLPAKKTKAVAVARTAGG